MSARLGIVGAGSMGGAVLHGAVEAGILSPSEIVVADPNDDRRREASNLGCIVSSEAKDAFEAQQVVLAVKPQVFPTVAKGVGGLARDTIVISVMAGLHSSTIRTALGERARIVRVMPNTPCRVRAGVSAIALGAGAQPGDEALAHRILASLGEVVEVDESKMHAVTAVSGSGPAYVFLLAEAMEQAAIAEGFDRHTARTLAYGTIHGAGRLLAESPRRTTADDLRTAVTSPGGTTAAALEFLFEREFPQIVAEAILAARERGQELEAGDA